jgi:hypothetical protein
LMVTAVPGIGDGVLGLEVLPELPQPKHRN